MVHNKFRGIHRSEVSEQFTAPNPQEFFFFLGCDATNVANIWANPLKVPIVATQQFDLLGN